MYDIINVRTTYRTEMINITGKINDVLKKHDIKEGICCVYVPHTTAAVTINENADPSVKSDVLYKLEDLIPKNDSYTHLEGNSDGHVKSILTGNSISIIIDNSRLVLGSWQGLYFCEFDGPRNRKVYVKAISS